MVQPVDEVQCEISIKILILNDKINGFLALAIFSRICPQPRPCGAFWGRGGQSRYAQALHHPHSFFSLFFIEEGRDLRGG
jgi:hypothetical protein